MRGQHARRLPGERFERQSPEDNGMHNRLGEFCAELRGVCSAVIRVIETRE